MLTFVASLLFLVGVELLGDHLVELLRLVHVEHLNILRLDHFVYSHLNLFLKAFRVSDGGDVL